MNQIEPEPAISPKPVETGRIRLSEIMSPFRDKTFWIIQFVVLILAFIHNSTDRLGILVKLGELYNVSLALFLIPLVIVALRYKPSTSLITGIWALIVTIPDWAFWHRNWDQRLSVVLLIISMAVVAAYISRTLNREKAARHSAVLSDTALRASELKYRNLFEFSPVPVLIVSPDGIIQETNPAADNIFGIKPGQEHKPLTELIGANNAVQLLQSPGKAGETVAFPVRQADGASAYLKPTLSYQWDGTFNTLQVILKDVTEEHNRQLHLKAYAAAVTGAREEEGRRIARIIHDESIQPLILVCRQLDNSAKLGSACGPALAGELAEARKNVENLVSNLREFITSLRPPALDDFGLVTAMRSLAREYRDRSEIDIVLSISGDYTRLSTEKELGIFRIAQEAVSNAVLHSRGSKIILNLHLSEEEVKLEVIDNGIGFSIPPAGQLVNTRHFGIIGMQERADMFGGKITIDSAVGKGTKVTASVRLQETGGTL